jgi:hypothetical protein
MQSNINQNTYITYELKNFFVKSQKLAGYLMMRGFVLKGISPEYSIETNTNTKRNIFIFNNTNELNNAIIDYKQLKLRNK